MLSPDLAARAAAWSRHEHARKVLGRVLDACREHSITALPVKGVLTAHLLHRDPSERNMQDIDLRVTPRDFPRLLPMGRAAGFPLLVHSRAYRHASFDVDGMMVEFEAHVGPRGVCGLTVEAMLARAEEHVAPFGFSHRQPELHDHALLLVINAFKDKIIEAAEWAIRDLELVGARGDFEPKRLAALAKESGVAALTWVVADWLADVRGHAGWAGVRGCLHDAPRKRYREAMRGVLNGEPRAGGATRAFMRLAARAASDRLPQRLLALGASALWSAERRTGRTG